MKIMLDRERTMAYSIQGARAFRKATGKSLAATATSLDDEETQVLVIWAMLVGDDPDLQPEAIVPYLQGPTLGQALKGIKEAFNDVTSPLSVPGPSASSISTSVTPSSVTLAPDNSKLSTTNGS